MGLNGFFRELKNPFFLPLTLPRIGEITSKVDQILFLFMKVFLEIFLYLFQSIVYPIQLIPKENNTSWEFFLKMLKQL